MSFWLDLLIGDNENCDPEDFVGDDE